jgi:hypothetical protein
MEPPGASPNRFSSELGEEDTIRVGAHKDVPPHCSALPENSVDRESASASRGAENIESDVSSVDVEDAPQPVEEKPTKPDRAPRDREAVAEVAPQKRGVIHPASKRSAVYWLAAAVLGMGVGGFSLAVADAVLDAQQLRPGGIANWAMVLIAVALIHAGYALYLYLFPDWSTVWVVSLVMLVTATAYAMMLAVLALGGGNTPLATAVQLNEFPDQRPELVCLIMLSLSGLLSYLLGRNSMRWRRSDQLLAASTAGQS